MDREFLKISSRDLDYIGRAVEPLFCLLFDILKQVLGVIMRQDGPGIAG